MNTHTPPFQPVSQDDVAWLGTDPIPASPYYDPAYFELERKAVFLRSWIQVGHVCELPDPGSFIRREIEFANASILIVRGKDGAIRAFHNVCTHRGTQLVMAEAGRQSTFSCPYHMWTFATDGALVSAPDFDQFHVAKKDCALPAVAVGVCAGLIFLSFAERPEPLRDWLGDLADRLEALPVARATTFSEYVYEIDANWKLTYDNFQENYHLRFIHPRSGGAATGPDNPFGYPVHYGFHGPHRTQTIWSNRAAPPPPAPALLSYGKAAEAAAAHGIMVSQDAKDYFALFPNFFLLGSPLQHFSHVVMPISATRSRGVIRLYWIGEDDSASERFAREYLMATARDIHSEDRGVIERGQRGLSSGALQHIHLQTQEILCRHLFRSVDAAVEAYKAEMASGAEARA
ncbi:aromatic ring-hydroxylating dioxygenase subunit alpha [Sphingobium sufflavum]|uniref:aromatic ring-hydroxylating oxygenase subunit alpha n=1 Tax=Sphingobium sufflavum TaxID=1129547 RepID=UPI001F3F9CDD|nr:aromatic ring-hydroxylating dioxygenase subunit alpha [Sphingobium sufflavum]MCE7797221.1 aromatic ring-hydroxylating dioxygenase subunit alpha [Sphingobium sufflavum]